MTAQQIIQRKRDGGVLTPAEIDEFVGGIVSGAVQDSQLAAFAMAVYLQGMSLEERVALTLSMRDSGVVLDWRAAGLEGPVVDKHSTGGVGDVVSLILGPLVAACGGFVPMVSGRGLGHTGGTVDKLESIPGYQTAPSLDHFRQVVRDCGVAIVGQTSEIAPADRRLYAVRDVTATIESIDLITSSILSKKLAAGLDALVMDVKVGSGAFMPTREKSEALANSIVEVSTSAGVATSALLTDMSQCLAASAGNAVEVAEAAALLRGEMRSHRLFAVTLALAGELLVLSGLDESHESASSRLQSALNSGAAADRFNSMVRALGGPADFVENAEQLLPQAPCPTVAIAEQPGYVARIDTRKVGEAVVALGGGRTQAGQTIDHAVGLTQVLALGEYADASRPLAVVHARDDASAAVAVDALREAFTLSENAVQPTALLYGVVRN